MKKYISGEKRLLSIVLVMILAITSIPTVVFAKTESKTHDTAYELMVSEKPHKMMEKQDGGYIPQSYDTSKLTTTRSRARIALPTKFNRVTQGLTTSRMEDQGQFGTCWSFSSLGSAESSLFQQNKSTDVDFSQRHLAYFTYNAQKNLNDDSDGTNNDKFALQPGASHMQVGGNNQMVIATLSRGIGPELEANVPYSGGETPPPMSTEYNEAAFLKNADYLPNKDARGNLDGTAIKTALMQRGSISASYGSQLADTQSNGADYRTFYSDRTIEDVSSDEYGGHAIQIIGWDDTVEAAKFTDNKNGNTKPAGNGAWIIKNSWGDASQDKYFYMSYYTSSLSDFCIFDMDETANLYDNNYQYDGIGHVTSLSLNTSAKYAYGANVFTADDNESLKRISFYTSDQETNYSINVYTGLTDKNNPTGGTAALATPQTGKADFMGYHTVELTNPINLKKGENFSVVVRFEQPNATPAYPVPIEMTLPNYCVAEIQPTQSFVALKTNEWYDMTNPTMFDGDDEDDISDYANVCIKAFTDTVKDSICISINKAEEISATSLQEAVEKSKIEIANITDLNIISGNVTNADWEYLSNLTALKIFDIQKEITAVEPMPDATASTSIFPKTISHTLLSNVPNISKFAFNECTSLSAVAVPNITSIDEFAFKGCAKLSLLGLPVIPPNVINDNAFEGADSVKAITFYMDFAEIASNTPQAKQARKDYKAVDDGNVNDNKWHTCIIVTEYAVSYNLNGGENSPNNPSLLTIDSPTITLSPATKKGYTFVGWFDAQIGGNPIKSLDGLGEKAVNLYARFTENVVTTADFAISPPANSDGWHNSAIVITPQNGYEQIWDSATSSWVSSLRFSSEGAAGTVSFKLKKADGTETTNYKLNNIKIDTSMPTDATITLETNSWKQFLNTVTFGLFFKESKTIEISATDLNGIKSIEYLLSDTVFNKISDITGKWVNLDIAESASKSFKGTFAIVPNSKQFIYAKIKDFSDNEVIINSQGIVAYSDSKLNAAVTEFDKNAINPSDIDVTMTLNENTLKEIKNGDEVLSNGTDYTVNGSTVTIKKEYLTMLSEGAHLLTFNFNPLGVEGNTVSTTAITITIIDTTGPTYIVTIPQKLEIGEIVKTAVSNIKVVPINVQATGVSNFNKFNKQLKITVQSANGNKLKNATVANAMIDYKLYSSYTDEKTNTPLNSDGLIMTVTGTAENDKNISKSFNGALTVDTGKIKVEGSYTDILTFTVSLEER